MTEHGADVFQEVYLRAHIAPVSIRNCILDQIRKPWYHDAMQEKYVKGHVAGPNDVIVLGRYSADGLPESGMVLMQENNGYKLVNITSQNVDKLSAGKYNNILQDFISRIVEPAALVGGFEIDFLSM